MAKSLRAWKRLRIDKIYFKLRIYFKNNGRLSAKTSYGSKIWKNNHDFFETI